jgi:hypothetical protein
MPQRVSVHETGATDVEDGAEIPSGPGRVERDRMGANPTPGRRGTLQPSLFMGNVSGEEQRIASPISVAHTAGLPLWRT